MRAALGATVPVSWVATSLIVPILARSRRGSRRLSKQGAPDCPTMARTRALVRNNGTYVPGNDRAVADPCHAPEPGSSRHDRMAELRTHVLRWALRHVLHVALRS